MSACIFALISLADILNVTNAQDINGNRPLCLRLGHIYDSPFYQQRRDLLGEVFAENGYCVSFVQLPANRAIQMMKNGELDAEIERTGAYLQLLDNDVIQIQPASWEFKAYLVSSDPSITSVSDLTDEIVAANLGYSWVKSSLGDYPNTIHLENPIMSAEMARRNRIKVFLASEQVIRESGIELDNFKKHLLESYPLYFYLNTKHRDIAPEIAEILTEYRSRLNGIDHKRIAK